jgi:hypothetical protein
MKKIVSSLVLVFLFSGLSFSQECDSLTNICYTYLMEDNKPGKTFISDGQVYQAFVGAEENAEFKVTFYGGTTYRIATTAGTKDDYVIFELRDPQGNVLFSNADYDNHPYWDFKVDYTIDCTVVAGLDVDKKVSGCLVLLIGFQN